MLRSDAGQRPRGKRVIESVIADMDRRRGTLSAPQLRYFLDTYQRTTRAIGKAIADARFEDPDWVERWDVAFARLYLEALDAGDAASRPWRLAFSAPAQLPPLRHVLLGINAHVNYDLPQALLAVISVAEFGDAALLDRRRHDHERIDGVLAARGRRRGRGAVDVQQVPARPGTHTAEPARLQALPA